MNENSIENEILYDTNENETVENIVEVDPNANVVTLETIHNDLGFICSFLIIASVVILIGLIYKFFDMFF